MTRLLAVVMLVLVACGHATLIRRTPISGVFELGGNRHMAMHDARQQMAEHCPGGYLVVVAGAAVPIVAVTMAKKGSVASSEG